MPLAFVQVGVCKPREHMRTLELRYGPAPPHPGTAWRYGNLTETHTAGHPATGPAWVGPGLGAQKPQAPMEIMAPEDSQVLQQAHEAGTPGPRAPRAEAHLAEKRPLPPVPAAWQGRGCPPMRRPKPTHSTMPPAGGALATRGGPGSPRAPGRQPEGRMRPCVS